MDEVRKNKSPSHRDECKCGACRQKAYRLRHPVRDQRKGDRHTTRKVVPLERRARKLAQRAAMYLGFDGRTGGKPRDGYGSPPHKMYRRQRGAGDRVTYRFDLRRGDGEHDGLNH